MVTGSGPFCFIMCTPGGDLSPLELADVNRDGLRDVLLTFVTTRNGTEGGKSSILWRLPWEKESYFTQYDHRVLRRRHRRWSPEGRGTVGKRVGSITLKMEARLHTARLHTVMLGLSPTGALSRAPECSPHLSSSSAFWVRWASQIVNRPVTHVGNGDCH